MLRENQSLYSPVELERPDYRADIDGLRAIAVLAVVLFHALPRLCPGGFVGVDIFFVISGYLISKLIYENLERGSFTLAEFYRRRIRRIFPALAVVLVAVFAVGTIVLLDDEYQQLGKHIAAGAGFVANIVLWGESGYFNNSGATKPLLHLWSLGVEEQFYIIWPLLLLIAWWKKWNLLWIALALAAISFGLNVAIVRNDPSAAFYLPASRFWELMVGAALAFATLRKQLEPIAQARNTIAITGAGLIGASLIIVNEVDFPGWWALLPTSGAALLIAAGQRAALNRSILSNQFLVGIGLISYPLYLWHWPLFSFARIIEGGAPAPATAAILILASATLAWLTYQYVEVPVRRASRTGRTAVVLCASLLLIGCAGYTAFLRLNSISLIRPLNEVSAQFVGPFWKYTNNETCLQRYPFTEATSYNWWFCVQSRNADPTVLLLGNSYANALYPGFANNETLKAQTILSIGDCGPYDEELAPVQLAFSPCFGHRWLDQAQFIDSIIATDLSLRYVVMEISGQHSARGITSILAEIDLIERHYATPIVFFPRVQLPYDIKSCVPRLFGYAAHSCEIDASERVKLDRSFKPFLDWLKNGHPNVLIFDQNDLFCDDTKCSWMHDGIPLVRDEHGHLSEYGSALLGQLFVRWATTNAPGLLEQ